MMDLDVTAVEVAKMTKLQKLAALLIVLGPDSAAQLLKNLDEHEIETVSLEMSKLTVISQEMQQEILREFTDVAVQASTAILGGVNFTKTALEKSVGVFRASDIIGRVAPARMPLAAMQQIIDMEVRQLFNLLKQEQPQTIALILSYLSPEKSSQLLMLLRGELRDQVVERLATLAPTPVEVVERIVEVLNQKAGVKPTRALSQTGGLKNAADLLNSMDKNLSQSMLLDLEKRNPELGQAIRQKMFTFEDLALLGFQLAAKGHARSRYAGPGRCAQDGQRKTQDRAAFRHLQTRRRNGQRRDQFPRAAQKARYRGFAIANH